MPLRNLIRFECLAALIVGFSPVACVPAVDLGRTGIQGTPFAGERLDYRVEWTGLDVGKITVIDHGTVREASQTCHKVLVYAKTAGTIRHLYDSRRQYVGFMLEDNQPWRYEEWEKEDDEWFMEEWLSFLPVLREVHRFKHGRLRNRLTLPEGCLDPVTAGYRLRAYRLRPGDFVETTVTQGKYIYHVTSFVRQGEILETLFGPKKTLVITPKVYWKGEPVGRRDLEVWLTDDDKQIPVRAVADIEFGSFTATLMKYRINHED